MVNKVQIAGITAEENRLRVVLQFYDDAVPIDSRTVDSKVIYIPFNQPDDYLIDIAKNELNNYNLRQKDISDKNLLIGSTF